MAQRRVHIPLEPVDSLTITTLVDNVFDVFMPDQGPGASDLAGDQNRNASRRHHD